MTNVASFIVLISFGALISFSQALPSSPTIVHVFMCADNGTYSGMSELHYIQQSLKSPTPLEIPFCQSAFFGQLTGAGGKLVPSLLVTSGIGSVNAALCTQSLIDRASSLQLVLSNMIYVGTSGFSPIVGGFNPTLPGGCSPVQNASLVSIGSVCVASAALDQTCGMCVSDATQPANECQRPNCHNHSSASLFGRCAYRGSEELQKLVMDANKGVQPAPMPETLAAGAGAWWAAEEGIIFNGAPPTVPTIMSNCVESDSREIWVGAADDYLCREYSAELLGTVVENVACVSAMEAVGFLRVLHEHKGRFPAAVIRGAANYDRYPLYKLYPHERWAQNTSYVSAADHGALIQAGYRYSILTTNNALLNFIALL
jgi:hypothetical protein